MKKTDEIIESIFSLLDYKNKNYGNAAAQPLNIFSRFNDTIKVGTRLDDKLARIKNSDTLRKNDVVDVIGYLFIATSIRTEKSYRDLSTNILPLIDEFKQYKSELQLICGGDITHFTADFIFKDKNSNYTYIINIMLKYFQIFDEDRIDDSHFFYLISLLILLCEEKGWTNFDEFKD